MSEAKGLTLVGKLAADLRREQARLAGAEGAAASIRVYQIFERLHGVEATGAGLLVNKVRKMRALSPDAWVEANVARASAAAPTATPTPHLPSHA